MTVWGSGPSFGVICDLSGLMPSSLKRCRAISEARSIPGHALPIGGGGLAQP